MFLPSSFTCSFSAVYAPQFLLQQSDSRCMSHFLWELSCPHLCVCVVADLMYPIRMIILWSDVSCVVVSKQWQLLGQSCVGLFSIVFNVHETHNRWSSQLLFYTSYTEQKYKRYTFVFACIFHEVKTSSVHTKQLYIIAF